MFDVGYFLVICQLRFSLKKFGEFQLFLFIYIGIYSITNIEKDKETLTTRF